MSQALESKTESEINTIAIYSGAHPAHQALLAGCCSENIKMLGEWFAGKQVSIRTKLLSYLSTAIMLRTNKATVIIIEGTMPTALMAPVIKLLNRHKKSIIALCADDALYRAFVEGGFLNRATIRFGFCFVSGIIAIGNLTAKLAKANLKTMPIEIRYPSISQDKVDFFVPLEPATDSHNLILIGSGSQYCKGADIATATLKILQADFPDAKLTVLGFRDLKEEPGIVSPGPVKDIRPYLLLSSVLIHPARGDAFPVAVIEAMLTGVVPFVSEWTGAASVAEKVSLELVVPLEPEDFAKKIASFWHASEQHRKILSDKCRQEAVNFVAQTVDQAPLLSFIEDIAHQAGS